MELLVSDVEEVVNQEFFPALVVRQEYRQFFPAIFESGEDSGCLIKDLLERIDVLRPSLNQLPKHQVFVDILFQQALYFVDDALRLYQTLQFQSTVVQIRAELL